MPVATTLTLLKNKYFNLNKETNSILFNKDNLMNKKQQQTALITVAANIKQALDEAKEIRLSNTRIAWDSYEETVVKLKRLQSKVNDKMTNSSKARSDLSTSRPQPKIQAYIDKQREEEEEEEVQLQAEPKVTIAQVPIPRKTETNNRNNALIETSIKKLQAALSGMGKIPALKNAARSINSAIGDFSTSNRSQNDVNVLKFTCDGTLFWEKEKIKNMKDPMLTRIFNALVNTMNTFLSMLDWMQSKVTGALFFRPNSPVSPAQKTLKEVNSKIGEFNDALDNLIEAVDPTFNRGSSMSAK